MIDENKNKAVLLSKKTQPVFFCFKIPSDSPLKKGRIFSSSPFAKGGLRRIVLVFYMDWVTHLGYYADQYKLCQKENL